MSLRYLFAGLGVIALAVALAIPAIAQPGWRAGGRWGRGLSAQSTTVRGAVTIDTAVERVKAVLAASGYVDLVPKEVMEFSNHFYVLVVEKSTGKGALELLVQRNVVVHPEPGPARTITRERARQVAAQFLTRAYPGATADEGTEFYGYFTFDVERGGKVFGMLRVNAYTGEGSWQ